MLYLSEDVLKRNLCKSVELGQVSIEQLAYTSPWEGFSAKCLKPDDIRKLFLLFLELLYKKKLGSHRQRSWKV